ncbi:MAG TPA: TonB-dependent receptor [Pedobacter sp.]|uniref:TonB-dependent receptor n=1 Tax=Pedobacter sp. TaxID=1411316 RepID=UPI002D1D3AE0|nr:TonB-dependent receptor [Pedobacter sp.]HMI03486.1 TonB-dependent receptor [Pedobacter sp.]
MQLNLHSVFTSLIPKLFSFIFTTFIILYLGTPLFAQAYAKITVPVTVNHQSVTAVDLLNELRNQTNYKFSFDPNELANVRLNNIRVQKGQLGNLLQELTVQGLLFDLSADLISVTYKKPLPSYSRQQSGRISGKVLDERGETLPGASIKVLENQKMMQSSVDGSYSLSLPAGTYTLEISYISYQTQRITAVLVAESKTTPLNIALKVDSKGLKEVVVNATYKQASVAGLYARQKNAASVTDGISAEQIARTPDNNMGQVLRRVSGVTTVDNKYVVVRGLSERYNQAMIDGVVLPSTNMNKRNFSFDVLPQELVSNVVVNKTATPDLSAEFSGGQISVNTLDIPEEDFTSINIGTGYNSRSTGKDFLMLGNRGKYDYLGFDDGGRKEPEGIISWKFPNGVDIPPPGSAGNADPLIPGQGTLYSSLDAVAQSKRLNADGLSISRYRALPHQNLRFAMGRRYDLKNGLRAGFAGGVTYRNQQNIVDFNNVRGQEGASMNRGGSNYMDSLENGSGKSYRFNSTIGAVLNLGLQGEIFKLALKNMYSRVFDDNFNEAYRLTLGSSNVGKVHEMFQEPQTTQVWQHKLEGENILSATGIKLAYTGGVTRIGQQVQDQRRLKYFQTAAIGGIEYFQTPNVYNPGRLDGDYDYRIWTNVRETDYNWGLSMSRDFDLGKRQKNTVKVGYSGWDKHRALGVTRMIPYGLRNSFFSFEQPYETILDPANIGIGEGKAYYYAEGLNGPTFDGAMKTHAFYVMLDQNFFSKLRLVYGLRAEHYNLGNRQEEFLKRQFGAIPDYFTLFSTTGEKNWRILPSANMTYSLTSQMNFRAAYSKTAIRPDFRETAYFGFYDYELDANISGRQLVSTIVDNMDLRYEWYPSAGEIISVSGFYKRLDNPIELVFAQAGQYRFQNQHNARNYGLEMEIRKSLGFIADKQWLSNLTIFGNGTLIKSKVEVQTQPLPGDNEEVRRLPSQDRPLYGQAPWIINAGLTYQGNILGITASYNRSGERSNTIDLDPNKVEYEQGRSLLDVQISAQLLNKKAELKLNIANLFDEYILFYQNLSAFEETERDAGGNPGYKLINGTTAYERDKGDRVTYRAKTGRTASLSFTYKF